MSASSCKPFSGLLKMCIRDRTVHDGKWQNGDEWCYWDYPLIELAGKTFGCLLYTSYALVMPLTAEPNIEKIGGPDVNNPRPKGHGLVTAQS